MKEGPRKTRKNTLDFFSVISVLLSVDFLFFMHVFNRARTEDRKESVHGNHGKEIRYFSVSSADPLSFFVFVDSCSRLRLGCVRPSVDRFFPVFRD